jgi:hypothetical protein
VVDDRISSGVSGLGVVGVTTGGVVSGVVGVDVGGVGVDTGGVVVGVAGAGVCGLEQLASSISAAATMRALLNETNFFNICFIAIILPFNSIII